MIKVAITGNIASGKSQVEKFLSIQGFKIIDCDEINNYLLTNDINVINNIKAEFGKSILTIENKISKSKLSNIIFNSNEKRKKLEKILHKEILKKVNNFFKENKNEKIVFVSAALLFEAKWENYFDKIIFVSAIEEIRLQRLMKRNNYTKEEAIERIKSQQTEEEKIKKSDYIVYNNDDIEALNNAVLDILKKL